MEQSPDPQLTSQPTSEPAPQSAPEPASQPGQPAIKSFADFLKSPNRIAITSLAILFAIIAGLIIAIMIVLNSTTISDNSTNRFDDITEIPADYTPSTIRKTYPDINDQKAYYQKLATLTNDPSKLMDIGLSCASAMSWYEQKEYVKECVKNLTDEGITDDFQLANYYSLMMSLASDNDEMMMYYRKYISILNKINTTEQ